VAIIAANPTATWTKISNQDGSIKSMSETNLQDTYAPQSICFGCGPANTKGLRIKSIAINDSETKATWTPEKYHEAFPGVLNGGIIGTLLDCHSNWTACWHLMKKAGAEQPPCTVTADFKIELKRPTPTINPVELHAKVTSATDDRATIQAELIAGGKVCATCVGTFVAVKPGHPAYYRW
jgi:acyl-coenzyme A thioesterase PaaI-like protein